MQNNINLHLLKHSTTVLFESILNILVDCSKNREHFVLPQFENITVVEEDIPTKGAELYHKLFTLGKEREKIVINDISKDISRTFQVNPDINMVSIEYYQDNTLISKKDFTWEDKY